MSGVAAAAWAANLAASLGLAALLWLCWGLGCCLAGALRIPFEDALEGCVLSAGLGLGALSAATLLLGVARLYSPAGFVLFYALLGTIALAVTIRRWRPLSAAWRAWSPPWRDPSAAALVVATAGVWLFAVSPTIFYDTLVYHFAVPNLYLLRGGVVPLPTLCYSNFPLQTEMLYLLGLQLGGPRLASLLNLGFAVLTATALGLLARRLANPAAGRIAATLFLLAPPVLLTARFGTVELMLALCFTFEVYCLHRWREGAGRRWCAAAGLFAGWCFSTKYVGGLFALLPPLVFCAEDLARGTEARRRLFREAWSFFACAAAAALPWLAKNAAFTGNPLFPVFTVIFDGSGWSAAREAALLADAHSPWTSAPPWSDIARLPLDLVRHPERFGAAARSDWVWPVTLCGAAATLTLSRRRETIRLALILVGYFLVWASSFWLARLLIPAMAIGAVLVALALVRLRPCWRGAALTGLALWSAAPLASEPSVRRSLAPALGLEAIDAYLGGMISAYPVMRYINERLPPETRLLVIGESKVAYLQRDHVHASALDAAPLATLAGQAANAAEIEAALYSAGITHLLVNYRELARIERGYPLSAMNPQLKSSLARLIDERCRTLVSGGGITLCALPAR